MLMFVTTLVFIFVSSLIFHGSRPSETVCISSLLWEKSKQKPKTACIWPYLFLFHFLWASNYLSSQIHTELFSSRYADSNDAGR